MNLNGDYISDALGTGRRYWHSARSQYQLRYWNFHIRSNTRYCPKICRSKQSQPRLTHTLCRNDAKAHGMDWEAADLIINGMEGAISKGTVTYDFERLMDNAQLLTCSQFGEAIISHMNA